MDLGVAIDRKANQGSLPFKEIFVGFENVGAVLRIFGDETENVISELSVDVLETRGYLHIDDEKGCIVVNRTYLIEGDERFLYLDVVHELVHIRQHREGRELFDRSYAYVDRPTELEAWHATVAEARRIGFSESELVDYLRMDWITEEDFKRFLITLGVGK